MLTGSELLSTVKANPDLPKDQLMDKCGYSTVREDGKRRYATSDFMNAILEAQGIVLTPPKSSGGTGRVLSYKTKVMKTTGNVAIGKAYFEKLGKQAGSKFQIITGNKQIILKPIN